MDPGLTAGRPMPATGERMVPEHSHPTVFWDHVNRYRFAARFAGGRRVLDVACGEGYGTAALRAAGAAAVIGIDLDPAAVAHARRRYGVDAREGSADRLPLADGCVDMVVSFETIEHLADPVALLREAARVLAPGGRLVVSTPNADLAHLNPHDNPFHQKELTPAEFRAAVAAHFAPAGWYTQQPVVTRLLSARALAAADTVPACRPVRALAFRLRRRLCPAAADAVPAAARADPVAAAVGRRADWVGRLFDPSRVRPAAAGEAARYLIAVADKR